MTFSTVLIVLVCLRTAVAEVDSLSPAFISEMAQKVCSSPPDRSQSWIVAPLAMGVMSTYRITGDTTYLEWIRQWGRGFDMSHGDNGCRGQVWTDLYEEEPRDEYIAKTREYLDEQMENDSINGFEYWAWCDLLFMEPPVWAAMGTLENNVGYWDEMTLAAGAGQIRGSTQPKSRVSIHNVHRYPGMFFDLRGRQNSLKSRSGAPSVQIVPGFRATPHGPGEFDPAN